jgi:hypothetical protein
MAVKLLVSLLLVVGAACSGAGADDNVDLEVGESTVAARSTHCGHRWLAGIDGRTWRSDELPVSETRVHAEPDWPAGEVTEFEVTLVAHDALEVRATGSDVTHRYVPDDAPPGCA